MKLISGEERIREKKQILISGGDKCCTSAGLRRVAEEGEENKKQSD